MTTDNIIAVEGPHAHLAGAIVYWRLSNNVSIDHLTDELAKRGLDASDGPELPTPSTALARAARTVLAGLSSAAFVRRHKGTWYITRQTDADGEPVFDAAWGMRLDQVGRLEIKGLPSVDERELAKASYADALMNLDRTDVSTWLLRCVDKCDAISMRETGGIYFVPASRLNDFKQYTDALHEASQCRVRFIPAMHTDDAIDAIIESLEAEAASLVSTIEEDVNSGQFGPFALRNRAQRAEQLGEKLARYERSLGIKLDNLRNELEQLRGAAVSAALAAETDDDKDS